MVIENESCFNIAFLAVELFAIQYGAVQANLTELAILAAKTSRLEE